RLANQAMGTGEAKVHAVARSRYNEPLTGMATDQASPDRIHDRPLHSDWGAVPGNATAVNIVKNPGEERACPSPESAEATGPFNVTPRGRAIAAETAEPPAPLLPARALTDEAPDPRVPRQLVEEPGRVRTEPAMALRPNVALDTRDTEPNEVHVHIGRIEVTAVPQPAPPKRRAPASARGSMSLTDYLAQRQRRAP